MWRRRIRCRVQRSTKEEQTSMVLLGVRVATLLLQYLLNRDKRRVKWKAPPHPPCTIEVIPCSVWKVKFLVREPPLAGRESTRVAKRRAVSDCGFEPHTKNQRGGTRPLNTHRTPATKRTCPLPSPSRDCCLESKRLKVEAESLSLSLPKSNGLKGTSVESFSLSKSKSKSVKMYSDSDSESSDGVETVQRECECALRALGVRVLGRQEVDAMTGVRCEVLGHGSFGSCIMTQHPNTGAPLVIKTLYKGDLRGLLKEASNLHHLQVEGVQRLVGVYVQDVQIVSHFAGKAVNQYFQRRRIPLQDAAAVFVQVCCTLQHVVGRG